MSLWNTLRGAQYLKLCNGSCLVLLWKLSTCRRGVSVSNFRTRVFSHSLCESFVHAYKWSELHYDLLSLSSFHINADDLVSFLADSSLQEFTIEAGHILPGNISSDAWAARCIAEAFAANSSTR
jgi:transcriptional regulator of met regulon